MPRLVPVPRPLRAGSPWLPDMSHASLLAEVAGFLAGAALMGPVGFAILLAAAKAGRSAVPGQISSGNAVAVGVLVEMCLAVVLILAIRRTTSWTGAQIGVGAGAVALTATM